MGAAARAGEAWASGEPGPGAGLWADFGRDWAESAKDWAQWGKAWAEGMAWGRPASAGARTAARTAADASRPAPQGPAPSGEASAPSGEGAASVDATPPADPASAADAAPGTEVPRRADAGGPDAVSPAMPAWDSLDDTSPVAPLRHEDVEAARLEILRRLERGDIDVEAAAERLAALEGVAGRQEA